MHANLARGGGQRAHRNQRAERRDHRQRRPRDDARGARRAQDPAARPCRRDRPGIEGQGLCASDGLRPPRLF